MPGTSLPRRPLAATVSVEWMSDAAMPPSIAGRSMIIYAKQHAVPDLTEAPKLGMGYDFGRGNIGSFGVEPMFGTRNVLVILFDPNRPGHPAPSSNALNTAFFGASDSIADYFDEVSEGRFQLQTRASLVLTPPTTRRAIIGAAPATIRTNGPKP